MSKIADSKIRKTIQSLWKNYKYAALIFLLGAVLLLLPTGNKETQSTEEAAEIEPVSTDSDFAYLEQQESELAEILSEIDGAGKTSVLLALDTGRETVYQTDTKTATSNDSESADTQTAFGSGGEPVVQKTIYPVFRGAIIVCEGAERASVRLAVKMAVSDLTGLGSDKISVVKMKQ